MKQRSMLHILLQLSLLHASICHMAICRMYTYIYIYIQYTLPDIYSHVEVRDPPRHSQRRKVSWRPKRQKSPKMGIPELNRPEDS